MTARVSLVALSLLSATRALLSAMGPLLPDTTALDMPSGGCVNSPGSRSANCLDAGVFSDAAACAAACDAASYCSAITWHGPTTGEWAGHCVFRFDGIWVPAACGARCDHVASQKTSGWIPGGPPTSAVWRPSALPWGRIKTFWFGANASGLDNADTLALIARHSVGGYGWQTGHPGGGSVGIGEELQAQASTHLRDYLDATNNSRVQIFEYRQIQVALRLFAQCALAAGDPANAHFFLQDATGKVCLAGQPWGTSDPYWNFSDAGAADWWIDRVIGELATEGPLTSGGGSVFFDEVDQGECGYRGGTCDFSAFNATALQAAKNAVYARQVQAMNAANIVPILSLDNRWLASGNGTALGPPCALPEDDLVAAIKAVGGLWVRFYENWPSTFWQKGSGADIGAAMINNAIMEAAAGIPNVLHTGGKCPDVPPVNVTIPGRLGGELEFAAATYLIVAGPGTTLSISDDWYDASFCWHYIFDVDFGAPTGDAVRTGTYTWTRSFTKATASIDMQAHSAVVMLL